LLLWQFYQPIEFPDTGTYMAVARQLSEMDFSGYTGARTPVYPLLLLLAGFDPGVVWVIQSSLGVGIAAVLFVAAIRSGWPVVAASLAGFAPAISLNQLFWEANLLNETLAAFLLVVSVLLLCGIARGTARLTDGLWLGGVAGLVVLTRPMYIYLGPLYAVLIGLALGRRGRRAMAGFACAFAVLVVGWAGFNGVTVGHFGLTTLAGYNLSQHSGGFIELAPDRYAVIRDAYLTHRQAKLRAGQTHSMVIWSAREEIKRRTGLSDLELSAELTRMSMELFARHPALYLASAMRAWSRFWAVPSYWRPEHIASETLRGVLVTAWRVQRWLLRGANVALLVLALGWVLLRAGPVRTREKWLEWPIAATAVVLTGSGVQALLEFGENDRYSMPTQPLVLAIVVLAAYAVVLTASRRWLGRTKAEQP
jgi:hypothetical protein